MSQSSTDYVWSESDRTFCDYYRCPIDMVTIGTRPDLSSRDGYFKFGGAVAFGRAVGGPPAEYATDSLTDVSGAVTAAEGRLCLPFNLSEVATNLRDERYRQNGQTLLQKTTSAGAAQRLYYLLRPFMRVGVRKHLQKVHLNGWDKIPFPRWPVDTTVEARFLHPGRRVTPGFRCSISSTTDLCSPPCPIAPEPRSPGS